MSSVEGMKQLRRNLLRIKVEGGAAIREVNIAQAEQLLTASRPLVPVDKGALAASGVVVKTKTGANVVYGGKSAPYAVYVHDDLQKKHDDGSAKFLERPATARIEPTGQAWAAAFTTVINSLSV